LIRQVVLINSVKNTVNKPIETRINIPELHRVFVHYQGVKSGLQRAMRTSLYRSGQKKTSKSGIVFDGDRLSFHFRILLLAVATCWPQC